MLGLIFFFGGGGGVVGVNMVKKDLLLYEKCFLNPSKFFLLKLCRNNNNKNYFVSAILHFRQQIPDIVCFTL